MKERPDYCKCPLIADSVQMYVLYIETKMFTIKYIVVHSQRITVNQFHNNSVTGPVHGAGHREASVV